MSFSTFASTALAKSINSDRQDNRSIVSEENTHCPAQSVIAVYVTRGAHKDFVHEVEDARAETVSMSLQIRLPGCRILAG